MKDGWLRPAPAGWEPLIEAELSDDIGAGDLTSALFDPEQMSKWELRAQADGVLSGVMVAAHVLQPSSLLVGDGEKVGPEQVVMAGESPTAWLLGRERTALNVLMHLSGIATMTATYVDAIAGTGARVVDTRKTLPGLRRLQKYAVRCGGGFNHRFGLDDAAMIKDNHIMAAGSITEAVRQMRARCGHTVTVIVEAETEAQAEEAANARADVILLDNFSPSELATIVPGLKGRAVLEASGGINLSTIRSFAETGVDVISVGALTHSVKSLSLHLEFV